MEMRVAVDFDGRSLVITHLSVPPKRRPLQEILKDWRCFPCGGTEIVKTSSLDGEFYPVSELLILGGQVLTKAQWDALEVSTRNRFFSKNAKISDARPLLSLEI